jgi:hypothetical protein
MKLICKYSGVEWFVPNHFSNNHRQQVIHPIFEKDIPVNYLLSRSREWAGGKLNEEECKLLFLSLFYKTGMIEFRCAANPQAHVVQNNMERLLHFVNWHFALTKPNLVLPSFVVSPDNKEMRNVKIWLETWEKKKKDWENGYRELAKSERLRIKEDALRRLINSAYRKVESYAKQLADWVMIAANVPPDLQEHWKPLFSLKDWDIYNARTVDLEELLEHMEDNLDAYTSGDIAAKAFQHIRSILIKNKAGLNLGMDQYFDPSIDPLLIAEKPYEFVDEVEEMTRIKIAKNAPEKEPKREDFPVTSGGKVEYIKAKAAWRLAQMERVKQIEIAQKIVQREKDQEKELIADSLDNITAGEDETFADEDIDKLQDFIKNKNPDEEV